MYHSTPMDVKKTISKSQFFPSSVWAMRIRSPVLITSALTCQASLAVAVQHLEGFIYIKVCFLALLDILAVVFSG